MLDNILKELDGVLSMKEYVINDNRAELKERAKRIAELEEQNKALEQQVFQLTQELARAVAEEEK